MPKRRTKRIKWILLVIICILGLLETTLLAFESHIDNNLHKIACSTPFPFAMIRGRVINSVTKQPIANATVTVQGWHRLAWTCEYYDNFAPVVMQTDHLGEFAPWYSVESEVRIEIVIAAAGCQTLSERATSDRFYINLNDLDYKPEFRLNCPA